MAHSSITAWCTMATKKQRKKKVTLEVIYEGLGNIVILKDASGHMYIQFRVEDDKLSDLYIKDEKK